MASWRPFGRNITVKVTRAEARMPADEHRSLTVGIVSHVSNMIRLIGTCKGPGQ